MRRLVVAILCLILAAPIIAQVPTPANATAQLAEQSAKREEAERKLLIREAADELEDAQTEQAYNRFEIVMGAFSVLITILVIVFGFRTEKAAARAAQNEIAGAKAEIECLLSEARNAASEAKVAQAALADTKAEIDALLMSTKSAAAEVQKNAGQIAETQRNAAQIFDDLNKMSSVERAAIKLSPEQEKIVEAAADESAEKPEQSLTIDEYKTRIGKASYIDQDWNEVLRLAQAMARHHANDEEALAFALNVQGDAYRVRNCHDEAIAVYDQTIERYRDANDSALQKHMMLAMYQKGYCLTQQGRASEAEDAFRALLPVEERVNGSEDSSTLVTRHMLALAILEQGRAAEAEGAFRALLPVVEQVDGAEHNGTFVTRYCLARAVFENGDAAEASAILADIPDKPAEADFLERQLAQLIFIRAKVADKLGNRGAADDWLAKAAVHFAAAYPPDHYYRQKFDAYVISRKNIGGETDQSA